MLCLIQQIWQLRVYCLLMIKISYLYNITPKCITITNKTGQILINTSDYGFNATEVQH